MTASFIYHGGSNQKQGFSSSQNKALISFSRDYGAELTAKEMTPWESGADVIHDTGRVGYHKTSDAEVIRWNEIIEKYKIKWKMPDEVLQTLENGKTKESIETQKKATIENFIIANNKDCFEAMQRQATDIRYQVTQVANNVLKYGALVPYAFYEKPTIT